MIKYFVELLSRIGSVSIFVESDEGEELNISKLSQVDEQLIKLELLNSHQSVLFIPLPITIPIISNIESCFVVKNGSISIRLPITNTNSVDRSTNQLMNMSSNYKWSSKFFQKINKFVLNCLKCDILRIDSNEISLMSEMPSELWAEMMDFWHCHKPHHDHDHSHNTERFSSLKPIENGIIAGSYYFAFNINDKVVQNLKNDKNKIFCSNCNSIIGEFDTSSGLQKIFKWSLSLNYCGSKDIYEPHNYIYNSLLDTINSNATRIIEFSNFNEDKKILIWVFNVGIDFIISGSKIYRNGLKVYYTTDLDNIEQERIDRGELEQIKTFDVVIEETINHLQKFNSELPKSIKTMGQNWKLGLIINE